MSPAAHVHFSTGRTWSSPRSKRSSRSRQNQQGLSEESITSFENPNPNLSNCASSHREYHLKAHRNPLEHIPPQSERSGGNSGKAHRSHSFQVYQSFQHNYVDEAFRSPDSIASVAANHNLHLERMYLLSSLQREDHRATDMLKQIQLIHQYLDLPFNDVNGHQNRNDRKRESLPKANSLRGLLTRPFPQVQKRKLARQLIHLKNRLSETTKQEKCMLARLEQVDGEIIRQGNLGAAEQPEEIWGFADSVNLHTYGWGFDGVGGINGLGSFHLPPNARMTEDTGSGSDTPSPGASPRAQTPIEIPVEIPKKIAFDPRSPSFIPRTSLPASRQRQHSLIDWAEPQYKHIMDEVNCHQVQPARGEKGFQPPLFSLPRQASRRSSLIDWSDPQYAHVLEEVRHSQEQRAQKMQIQSVRGLKRVQIQKAPASRSMHASIVEVDSQEVSPASLSHPPFFGPASARTSATISSAEAPTSTPCLSGLQVHGQEQSSAVRASLHENYQVGLAKIRAASVAYKQTLNDNIDDEDQKRYVIPITRSSWSAGTTSWHE